MNSTTPETPSPGPASPERRRHSGYGIASVVIAVLCAGINLALVGAIIYIGTSTPGGLKAGDPRAYQIGAGIAVAGLGHGIGLVLGVAGLFQRRRKVTAIIGTLVNALFLLLLCGIAVYGLSHPRAKTDGGTLDESSGIVDARHSGSCPTPASGLA